MAGPPHGLRARPLVSPPQRTPDELIDDDPPQAYNILLVVLGCAAILLYFLLVQPELQHLSERAQRPIGFFVFVIAYVGTQWFGYRA
jgi:hypothetical protein